MPPLFPKSQELHRSPKSTRQLDPASPHRARLAARPGSPTRRRFGELPLSSATRDRDASGKQFTAERCAPRSRGGRFQVQLTTQWVRRDDAREWP